MRELLFTHKDILLKLEKTERKSEKQDMEIQLIFNALKKNITCARNRNK